MDPSNSFSDPRTLTIVSLLLGALGAWASGKIMLASSCEKSLTALKENYDARLEEQRLGFEAQIGLYKQRLDEEKQRVVEWRERADLNTQATLEVAQLLRRRSPVPAADGSEGRRTR